MNTRKGLLKTLKLSAAAIAFAMLPANGGNGLIPASFAQEPPPPLSRPGIATFFGMQTLAPAQTALITVVNPSAIIPCIRVRIAFDIYEADPSNPIRLRFVRSVSRVVELDPGEAVSIEYTAGLRGALISPASFAQEIDESGDPHTTTRVDEQGQLNLVRTRATAATSTLVINERGRVVYTSPGVRVGFDPQPDPPSN